MAVQRRIIREILKMDSPEGWHWGVITEIPGLVDPHTGKTMRHIHAIPPDAFEWRAAEYDLDAEKDFDTIVDIILHETRIKDPMLPINHADDAAAAKGLLSPAEQPQGAYVAQGDLVPTHLYNAETVEKAREALLARVEKVKAEIQLVVSPQVSLVRGVKKPPDPLDVLRQEKFIDPGRMQEKRHLVETTRKAKLDRINERRAMKAMTSPAPRAASKPLAPATKKLPKDDTVERRSNT